jgi:hypothetical protein
VTLRAAQVALSILVVLLLPGASVRAATEVQLDGRVVIVAGSALVLDADGAHLMLDVSEVDPRFLQWLKPGDDVRVTAFRLPDGSLLVYHIFLLADTRQDQPEPEDSDD